MANKTALGYVLDDSGRLVDAFIQCETADDPAPTQVETEIVRIVKEHREFDKHLRTIKKYWKCYSGKGYDEYSPQELLALLLCIAQIFSGESESVYTCPNCGLRGKEANRQNYHILA